jgi:4-aminobutyrate aminotransferase-like enzyme
MNDITPPDITGFLFPLSGAEANEVAIRAARRFTGK